MGKWNHRRWASRKKYNQPSPPPPPTYYETEFKLRGAWRNTALPWEERFCISVGIPWQKVVVAKKYMHCHDNVIKWNDAAGEEAFCNAKKRFWAQINSLPCDTPALDPNTYVDEINWNLDVDPDLMLEIDREYFNPDEAGKVNKLETNKINVQNFSSGWGETIPSIGDNPWECSRAPSNGASEDVAHGWGPWDKSINVNTHNPWEGGNIQDDAAVKDNMWGVCADKSWDWKTGVNAAGSGTHVCQRVGSFRQEGWGNHGNSSSGWENNDCGSRKAGNILTSWNTRAAGASENKRWKDCRVNSSAWEQNQGHVPSHLGYSRHDGSGRSPNGGCLKREGSQQYTSRYKSSRFQADDYAGDQWRKQRNQNRVRFGFE